MKFLLSVILTLPVFALPFAQLQCTSSQKLLNLKNVTIIDATGAPPAPSRSVEVQDGRISKIVKTEELAIPPNAQVIDLTGKFLIPGLWDMHVHTLQERRLEKFFPAF